MDYYKENIVYLYLYEFVFVCFWLHSVMVLSREYQFVFSWFNLKLNNTCCWWEGSNSIGAFSSMKPKNWSSNWCKTHVLGTKHMYLLEAKQRNDLQISLLFHCVRINIKNPRECRWLVFIKKLLSKNSPLCFFKYRDWFNMK